MPTISMFYGIIISLYFFDNERHNLPHIHAKYQGQDASFSILNATKGHPCCSRQRKDTHIVTVHLTLVAR